MLPWNSGRPLLIRVFWAVRADNVAQLIDFEILHET
nr:Bm893 [Brugia malayi]